MRACCDPWLTRVNNLAGVLSRQLAQAHQQGRRSPAKCCRECLRRPAGHSRDHLPFVTVDDGELLQRVNDQHLARLALAVEVPLIRRAHGLCAWSVGPGRSLPHAARRIAVASAGSSAASTRSAVVSTYAMRCVKTTKLSM